MGLIITFLPITFRVMKKKRYDMATFFILMIVFAIIGIIYYLAKGMYMELL